MKEFTNSLAGYAGSVLIFLALFGGICVIAFLLRYLFRKKRKKRENTEEKNWVYEYVSNSPFQIFLLVRERDLYPIFISDSVEKITGISKEDLKADLFAFSRCMNEEESRKLEKAYTKWDKKEPLTEDFAFRHIVTEEKGWLFCRVDYIPERNLYVVMFENITRQKNAEEKLREELLRAREENEAKTEFLSEMSHEIRTPMNGIMGLLELAKMDVSNTGSMKDYLDKTQNLSRYLLNLINDILDLTRIENGKIELQKESFDLIDMAERLRSMFQKTIEEKGVHFEFHLEGFEVRRVIGDEMRLNQVVINFLSNASKFTDAGGTVSLIFRQMQIIGNHLRLMIQVRDTGKGMAPEFLSHIFKPFEQENNMIAKKYGGSGLGMSIADNIIRLMGGQIVIDSEVGKGSDFTVFLSLPIAEQNQEPRQESCPPEKVRDESEWQRYLDGAHVLLAEDNDINARITTVILEKSGVIVDRVLTGETAVEAFEKSEEGHYDLILMDIQMPVMDGWEATRLIREMNRKDAKIIPIYALSANSYVEDKRQSVQAGMNDHIAKPIDFDGLKRNMGLAIRNSRNEWNALR